MEYLIFRHPEVNHPTMMSALREMWEKLEARLQDPDLTEDEHAVLVFARWATEREAGFLRYVH